MNDFIFGFGFLFRRIVFRSGYEFLFPFFLGRFGYVFYVFYVDERFINNTLRKRAICFRFRKLNKALWRHLDLSSDCFVFSFSRGYHFLIDDGSEWLS